MTKNIFLAFLLIVSFGFRSQTKFTMDQSELVLPGQVYFETASDKIKLEESKTSLEHIKAYLSEKTYVTLLRIESHSDNSGTESTNQKLTESRAKAVYTWLVANGIDCKRLIATGFGSTKPKAENNTAEGKAQNRRISVVTAELRGRAIGGMPVDGGGIISTTCR